MPEYVYASHDFIPENPDEVPFKAGEKIEVIEKDDLYQDGWWQGRNSEGRVGLFPQTYTSPEPPAPSSAYTEPAQLPPVTFPGSSSSPTNDDPSASSPSGSHDDRERTLSQGERTLQATLTDVQTTIEQLGRTGGDTASFTYASSHGDYTDRDTETEGGESEDEAGTDWHRSARERLAVRAQQENQERQARESTSSLPTTPLRVTQPPIDVEVSDESEDEEPRTTPNRRSGGASPEKRFSSQYPHIPEEDEAAAEAESIAAETSSATETAAEPDRDTTLIPSLPSAALTPPSLVVPHVESESGHIEPSEDFIVPSPSAEPEDEPSTVTADRLTFPDMPLTNSPDPSSYPNSALSTAPNTHAMPTPIPPVATPAILFPAVLPESPETAPAVVAEVQEPRMPGQLNPFSPVSPENIITLPAPAAVPAMTVVAAPAVRAATSPSGRPTPSSIKVHEPTLFLSRSTMPSSPGRSSLPSPGMPLPSPSASSATGSVGFGSQSGIQQTLTPATTLSFKTAGGSTPQHDLSSSGSQGSQVYRRPASHPSEWTLEEVIEWLKGKGFDQAVCDKFIEQEITGDVLLELDANVLKTEFGIAAFGKRVRIVNAIAELRRPPSFNDDPHPMPALSDSRSQSLNYGHSHSSSMASSAHQSFANSPLGYAFGSGFSPAPSSRAIASSATLESPGYVSVPEVSGGAGSFVRNGWRTSDPPSSAGQLPAVPSEVNLSTPRMSDNQPLVPSEPVPQPPAPVGLGLGLTSSTSHPGSRPASPEKAASQKSRPSNLLLSSSDANLKVRAVGGDIEDRTALSDSETAHLDQKAKRRRLFGRSTESASIKEKASSLKDNSSRHSKESTPVLSADPTKPEATEEAPAPRRRPSKKKGSDDRKPADRLSLFGGTLSGTLGKGRKPVPKLSVSEKNEKPEKEKGDHESLMASTFQRMRHPSGRKHSSRPSTSDGVAIREKERVLLEPEPERDFKPRPSPSLRERSPKDSAVLRKRTSSTSDAAVRSPSMVPPAAGAPLMRPGRSVLEQIGTSDHNGWMRKKNDQFNSWRMRYFVLKGPHLYILKSNDRAETKIKGYINIVGYRVVADENIDPGRYGFRLIHDSDKTHFFSHDEQLVIREWMKALMKATISRDFSNPVVSSSNIPTIPLTVAQAMNPSPRPPSPTARAATQRAHRRDNPNQLSSRDAQILMGMGGKDTPATNGERERARLDSFFTNDAASTTAPSQLRTTKATSSSPKPPAAPPRPTREIRRKFSTGSQSTLDNTSVDPGLIEWANTHLPDNLKITDPTGSLCSGLALLRLAEDIKGRPASPPVPDSAFPTGPNDDRLDGLFRLFDFLLDNDVKMGTVSINDIRQGRREKVAQLLNALKNWEEKRKAIAVSISQTSSIAGNPFMGGPIPYFIE
ncbi:hypothetical protein PHLGIDRAFT_125572 [Phlebiopsis gigantea 11061_1 CR5-6]|uniref:Uncharacterized protein n=1 Tax=Phlebiopsis gigantea (strain 11061_1 CR5-6) TaxID=745531 RepID=A0A0C3NY78_PHLG1|nr:hypothetical protein PHLGIDRAFT_125572 [Phlebiopsis gigantea 11061_1 CR5-6]